MPPVHAVHWVVAADASRAQVFAANLLFESFETVEDRVHTKSRAKDQDLVASAPGHTQSSSGSHQSALDRHTEPHEVEVAAFARELGALLNEGRKAGHFERLVLVAPPRFLGHLRQHIDAETTRAVVGSVSHDWTRLDGPAIAARVREAAAEERWGAPA